jgi:hypothetical protein
LAIRHKYIRLLVFSALCIVLSILNNVAIFYEVREDINPL